MSLSRLGRFAEKRLVSRNHEAYQVHEAAYKSVYSKCGGRDLYAVGPFLWQGQMRLLLSFLPWARNIIYQKL